MKKKQVSQKEWVAQLEAMLKCRTQEVMELKGKLSTVLGLPDGN